jgi:hypothetical protein
VCTYSARDDSAGVLFFLGSGLGCQSYVNPLTAERVAVSVSSPRPELSLAGFVGRAVLPATHELKGSSGSKPWFSVHLGEWHVRPYCYRLTSSSAKGEFPRHWVLQGQRGGSSAWKVINEHNFDESFKSENETNLWPLFGVEEFYNAFRVLLTGPTADGNFALRLGNFEVYGELACRPASPRQPPVAAPTASNSLVPAKMHAPVAVLPVPDWFKSVLIAMRLLTFFSSGGPLPTGILEGEEKAFALLKAGGLALFGEASRDVWAQLVKRMNTWSARNNNAVPDADSVPLDDDFMGKFPAEALRQAMRLVARANELWLSCINLVDMQLPPSRSALTDGFRGCLDLVLLRNKQERWQAALAATQSPANSSEISVDPLKAAAFQDRKMVDEKADTTFFGQMYTQLRKCPASKFAIPFGQRAFSVKYKGLRSTDAGGPYRDCIEHMATDLMSKACGLFLPSPNFEAQMGDNRDCWVPNTGATSVSQLDQYEFLGKMMGLSLRTRNLLNLQLPSLVWKPLVGAPVSLADVVAVDVLSGNALRELQSELSKEEFEKAMSGGNNDPCQHFVATGSDGKDYPLVPNGAQKALTFENRQEYSSLLLRFRLDEFKRQTQAIRRGLGKVVPLAALAMFSWSDLEVMVCGRGFSTEDVDLLQKETQYKSGSANDRHIKWFWEVLREFTDEQRAMYLTFVWGRSRLPTTSADFPEKHKIDARAGGDGAFPLAHTCFFTIDLPAYSSKAILKQKLATAISMYVVCPGAL